MRDILSIRDLRVRVDGKEILHGVTLNVGRGETHMLFGPNGSGKTTLIMAIMGFPKYEVTEGSVLFKGQDITGLSLDERARLGMGISFQRPPTIRGLNTRKLVDICAQEGTDWSEMASQLNVEPLLDRDVNLGFSGGEIKRAELLQLFAQRPEMVFLDEPESGVDLENLAVIGAATNHILGRDKPYRERREQDGISALIISHTGHIMDYISPDVGHVMCDGMIGCSGNPADLLGEIRRMGYEECIRCQTIRRS